MIIAFSSSGMDLSADVDPRFGRAAYFIFANPDTMEYECIENKQNLNLPQGAGIQSAKTIVEKKADILITGNCGPKAYNVLKAAGVKIIVGAKGKISDVIQDYKNNAFNEAQGPNVQGHWM